MPHWPHLSNSSLAPTGLWQNNGALIRACYWCCPLFAQVSPTRLASRRGPCLVNQRRSRPHA
eukprot:285199-Alexandrium_andersonii.AAC.1